MDGVYCSTRPLCSRGGPLQPSGMRELILCPGGFSVPAGVFFYFHRIPARCPSIMAERTSSIVRRFARDLITAPEFVRYIM